MTQSIKSANQFSGQKTVVIAGGSFRRADSRILVQKRSWEMLRIFSDQIAEPIFLMRNAQADRTHEYALPEKVKIVTLPTARGKLKLAKTIFRAALSSEVKQTINDATAVYLRQPLWECWDLYKYARKKQKKILVSFHGDWPGMLKQPRGSIWKRIASRIMSHYIAHIYKTMASRSHFSFFVGEALQEKYGNTTKKETVFANFLHTKSEIAMPRPARRALPYIILFVGQLEEYKGLEYLIRAASLLKKNKIDFRLILVGTGSLDISLHKLVKHFDLDKEVEWHGYIQHGPKLMTLYRNADLFVLPSISGEGTPKVLMEAMSQGVPVISTDVGNTRNLLNNGHYGSVLPPADAKALFSALNELLANHELRAKLSKRGLELARISTRERQMEIVKEGLQNVIPETLGKANYL